MAIPTIIKRFMVSGLAVVLTASVWALPTPPVIDRDMLMNSSPEVRKAFLVRAGNMITLESAYSKEKGTRAPVAGVMATAALDGLTLDETSSRITAGMPKTRAAATCL